MKRLTLDYETRSELELPDVGAWIYAHHPSTEIICAAWKVDDGETKLWFPIKDPHVPKDLEDLFCDENVLRVAHNAFFEQMITEFVLGPKYGTPRLQKAVKWNPRRWRCTAAKARYHSIPGKLEMAAKALGLPVQKDMIGNRLSIQMAKVRPYFKKDSMLSEKWFEDPPQLKRLGEYCIGDVDVERLLDLNLPDLPEYEQEVWFLDQEINCRGIEVDVRTCQIVLNMVEDELLELSKKLCDVTGGRVTTPNQLKRILDFLSSEGVEMVSLDKAAVEEALGWDLSEDARTVLEIRQAASMSSIKKYEAFIERADKSDSRVRDLLVYCGASPTARWSGAGVQPQNFPRGSFGSNKEISAEDEQEAAIWAINGQDRDLVRLGFGSLFEVFSSCLRGMIKASPGMRLFGADYASIEARVLWWLAGHDAGLAAYREGKDIYKLMASIIFGVSVESVAKAQREIGKRAVLGCGYGMGAKKFMLTCHEFGATEVTEELAKKAVDAYRSTHAPVPALWSLVERAAIYAVQNPGKKLRVRPNPEAEMVWGMSADQRFLCCKLPSGRVMYYPFPSVKPHQTPWGETKPTLFYWGIDAKTKQWREESSYGGKLVENLCQAVARDLMVNGMFKARDAGYHLTMTVHDELKSEKETGSIEEFERLVTDLPPWAKGLPLAAEGWEGLRYRK